MSKVCKKTRQVYKKFRQMKTSNLILLILLILIISWLTTMVFVVKGEVDKVTNKDGVALSQDSISIKSKKIIQIKGNGKISILQTKKEEYLYAESKKERINYQADTLVIQTSSEAKHRAKLYVKNLHTLILSDKVRANIEAFESSETLSFYMNGNAGLNTNELSCSDLNIDLRDNSWINVDKVETGKCKRARIEVGGNSSVKINHLKDIEVLTKIKKNGRLRID